MSRIGKKPVPLPKGVTATVVHMLAERGAQFLRNDARHGVDTAAGRERHDHSKRARGVFVLRHGRVRCGRGRERARGE